MVRQARIAVREQARGATIVLSVEGELDISTVSLLEQHVDAIDESPTNLTLDLSDLTFMDSSGLRFLIELNGRAQREAWKLSLIPSQHEPANLVLRITGADAALPFAERSPE
jgi:stage II sporulation protein AA (anti-sigma F factor antagonist)